MRIRAFASLCVIAVTGTARADDLAAASRKAADTLATALMAAPEAGTVSRVAVLPFAEGPGLVGAARAVSGVLAARLGQVARVAVVDPEALRAALGEQRLAAMLGAGRADLSDLASRAGTQAVVTGSVDPDGARVRVSARLALVAGGKVIATAQVTADAPARAAGGESGAIEVSMRRLSDGLAGGLGKLPGSSRYRRLAVITFSEVGERAQKKKLGTIVTAEVATNLKRDHGLFLVERAKLGEVLSELRLQEMTAAVDSAQASRIGQMADAQAIVVGSVAEAGDRYLVTARVVATQTGEALAAESVSVPEAGMTAIASDAVVLRSRGDAVMRSLLFPGLGQAYNRQPVKAIAFAGAEVALIGAAVAYHVAGTRAWNDYKAVSAGTANPSAEATRRYDLATSRFTTRNWLLVGCGAVWAAGLVDAWASGVDGQALLGGGTAAAPAERAGRWAVAPAATGDGAGLLVAGRF